MRRIRLPRQLPTVKFPLHYEGAPQRRLFFPEWYFTMVKPKENMPKNYVRFLIPSDMTKYDVKEYLNKIYDVPVLGMKLGVVGHIKHRVATPWKKDGYQWKFVEPFKIAHVYLADGQTFTFPDPLKNPEDEAESDEAGGKKTLPSNAVDQIDQAVEEDKKARITSDRSKIFFENKWL